MINKNNSNYKDLIDTYNNFLLTNFPKGGYYHKPIGDVWDKLTNYHYQSEVLFQKLDYGDINDFSPYDVKIDNELDIIISEIPLEKLNESDKKLLKRYIQIKKATDEFRKVLKKFIEEEWE